MILVDILGQGKARTKPNFYRVPSLTLQRRSRGFNFVEIVVAFGLLAVMVSIFFNLIPSSTLASLRAENRLSASNIAQNQLERLRATPFSDLAGSVTEEKRGSTIFKVTTSVSTIAGLNPDHIRLARVQVDWSERLKDQTLAYELRVFNQNR